MVDNQSLANLAQQSTSNSNLSNPIIITLIVTAIGAILAAMNIFNTKHNIESSLRKIHEKNFFSYIKKELIKLNSKNIEISVVFFVIAVFSAGVGVIQVFQNNPANGSPIIFFIITICLLAISTGIEKIFVNMNKIKEIVDDVNNSILLSNLEPEYAKGLVYIENHAWKQLNEKQKKIISESFARDINNLEEN
ncbi:MAG: hypothetical protein EPN86_03115 [Nanoarchaeota archaeon]|nr:MAG: hypothetical protein EPN86_03115 [Nanoarchaeota archaeon]